MALSRLNRLYPLSKNACRLTFACWRCQPLSIFSVRNVRCYADVASRKVERHEFQAETKNLLDIVAKSLYSDQEVRHSILNILFRGRCRYQLLRRGFIVLLAKKRHFVRSFQSTSVTSTYNRNSDGTVCK